MGSAEYAERIRIETVLHEAQGDAKLFHYFCRKLDVYGGIRKCLKISGLWNRSVRNYLDVRVERNQVFLHRLPSEFDGFRILHLTDLHADLHPGFVNAVARKIIPLEYDLILITGDFRSATFGDFTGATSAVIELSRAFKKRCYCVLGNHDSLSKVPRLEAAGLRFLLNQNVQITRGAAVLFLVGIDDPNYFKTHNFELAMAGIPEDACKILMSHSPETYKEAAELNFDFQLSGHTHGGQICLPGGRILVHDRTAPKHVLKGAWREGNLQGYTGRGTGATGLPARLNCPAEVTLHTLRCR